ncbi:kinase-like domain-containing protein [Pelagophyceae sp. CCMP2097]|nr:kinase-like domain-containing protein [Pelagophyceae sp. CCMP2097]
MAAVPWQPRPAYKKAGGAPRPRPPGASGVRVHRAAQQAYSRVPRGGAPSPGALASRGAPARQRTVGHYVLGRALGEGSFGKVRLGTHVLTGERVAVKVLEKTRLVEAADVQRVAREIKILKRNRHENIVQLFEVLDTPSALYLIMEHADAGELFAHIVQRKRLDEAAACGLFAQVADGAEYLHALEVTHRDLKPENLLLQQSRSGLIVKIVDFGLSNVHDGGALLATACGSPCYAAPEMIAGKQYWGPKADIWSMGVILYASVAGYLPFEDSNTAVLYKKIMAGDYACPNWLSRDCVDVLSRILNTDPEQRYSIAQIRTHRWYKRHEPGFSHTPRSAADAGATARADGDAPDAAVLAQMEEMGIASDAAVAALAAGAHDNVTTTYHLLVKRKQREDEAPAQPPPGAARPPPGARDAAVRPAAKPVPKLQLNAAALLPDARGAPTPRAESARQPAAAPRPDDAMYVSMTARVDRQKLPPAADASPHAAAARSPSTGAAAPGAPAAAAAAQPQPPSSRGQSASAARRPQLGADGSPRPISATRPGAPQYRNAQHHSIVVSQPGAPLGAARPPAHQPTRPDSRARRPEAPTARRTAHYTAQQPTPQLIVGSG